MWGNQENKILLIDKTKAPLLEPLSVAAYRDVLDTRKLEFGVEVRKIDSLSLEVFSAENPTLNDVAVSLEILTENLDDQVALGAGREDDGFHVPGIGLIPEFGSDDILQLQKLLDAHVKDSILHFQVHWNQSEILRLDLSPHSVLQVRTSRLGLMDRDRARLDIPASEPNAQEVPTIGTNPGKEGKSVFQLHDYLEKIAEAIGLWTDLTNNLQTSSSMV